jgi:hypothetical protein
VRVLDLASYAGTAKEVLEGLSVSQCRREHESVSGLTLEAQHTVAASILQIRLITSGGALTMPTYRPGAGCAQLLRRNGVAPGANVDMFISSRSLMCR